VRRACGATETAADEELDHEDELGDDVKEGTEPVDLTDDQLEFEAA
jgi:hypothetical protein